MSASALAEGRASTKKMAAEKFGKSVVSILAEASKSRPSLNTRQAAARAVAMGAMRAAAVLNELADCSSQRVRLEAAKTSLQAAGIVGGGQNVSFNVGVGVQVAGYVIDLSEPGRPQKIIGGQVIDQPAGE